MKRYHFPARPVAPAFEPRCNIFREPGKAGVIRIAIAHIVIDGSLRQPKERMDGSQPLLRMAHQIFIPQNQMRMEIGKILPHDVVSIHAIGG